VSPTPRKKREGTGSEGNGKTSAARGKGGKEERESSELEGEEDRHTSAKTIR